MFACTFCSRNKRIIRRLGNAASHSTSTGASVWRCARIDISALRFELVLKVTSKKWKSLFSRDYIKLFNTNFGLLICLCKFSLKNCAGKWLKINVLVLMWTETEMPISCSNLRCRSGVATTNSFTCYNQIFETFCDKFESKNMCQTERLFG